MQQEYYDIETDEPGDTGPVLDPDFDSKVAEASQLAILLDQGVTFTTPKRSLLRYVGQKQRTWLLKQPYLGTLDYLGREFLQLDFSEEAIAEYGYREARRLTQANAKRCARIIAIALLNSRWAIRLLTGLLSRYLLWRITPDKLLHLVGLINRQSNLEDFIFSIRLMSLSPRKTEPTRIETKTGANQPG